MRIDIPPPKPLGVPDEGLSGEEERRRLHEVACGLRIAVERARSTAALRQSEERYRILFNSIDEGCCILEVRIEPGEPLDYRFIDVNQAFERQSTLADAKGRWMRELRPGHEEQWFEIYRDVALTREPIRFEQQAQQLESRWFGVYAFPIGAPQQRLVGVLFKDITERRRLEQALCRAHEQLEQRVLERTLQLAHAHAALEKELHERRAAEQRVTALFRQLLTVQEDERRKIAREIHDQLAQQMTALRVNLEALGERCPAGTALGHQACRVTALAADLDQRIDSLMWDLRPAALEHLGLCVALHNLVAGWSRRSGVPAEFQGAGVDALRLAPHIEINLYRLVQEALHNVHRHADATRVGVLFERRGSRLVLVVEDDGRGFDPEHAATCDGRTGVGPLAGMRERAALIGGELEIESTPGVGTILYVRVPHDCDMNCGIT